MMSNDSIIINGGKKLEGEVRIFGSKNATVALIPAAVLASNVVTICDVPDISDVAALTTLLEELNIRVIRRQDHIVIDNTNIQNCTLDHDAVGKLRASYYFMGALLGRFRKVDMYFPGGSGLWLTSRRHYSAYFCFLYRDITLGRCCHPSALFCCYNTPV